jgi:YjbE family integral membrane protein
MDFSSLSQIFSPQFFVNLLSIVVIDLVLAGDNSIVIAMAVQGLPKNKRLKGILFGALAAVLLRIIFTFFAAKMLTVPFVKLGGGLLIFWIAFKLMNDSGEEVQKKGETDSIWQAMWIILVADFTMSLDNILAVAGASHGNLLLLIIGLGLSIPLVVFASALISKLMERFKIIIWIGAALLGKVGAEMIVTDPVFVKHLLLPVNLTALKEGIVEANHYLVWGAEALGAIVVVVVALIQRIMEKSEVDAVAKKAE